MTSKATSMGEQAYHQILKSTTIIGGSSVVNVTFRIIASKLVAVILGPSGVGLIGIFNAITNLFGTIAGMGLADSSGVRQMVDAAVSDDSQRIARTALVLQRLSIVLGIGGMVILYALRVPVSKITFGSEEFARSVGLLAPVVAFSVVSGLQISLLRGMRRVGDIARVSVLGMGLGTLLGLPLLFIWGQAGIPFYLLILAIIVLFVSWIYARKVHFAHVKLYLGQMIQMTREMLGLGVAFMLSSLTTIATTYLIKVIVSRQMGLHAMGLTEAAIALANVYVGFILGAMGADYFPHLTSVSDDNLKSSALMNNQIEVGLLIAAPGILLVLGLGPFLLRLLYSIAFQSAFEILRWQALGTFLRVITWPIGFITLAKGKGGLYFLTELSVNLVYLVGIWVLLPPFGLAGIGMAFFGMYIFYLLLMILVAHSLVNFSISRRNLIMVLFLTTFILVALFVSFYFSPQMALAINLVLAIGVGFYSLWYLYNLVGFGTIQIFVEHIWIKFFGKN